MSNYTYTKHNWEDKPSSNTPITAEKLNEIEEGIYNANENKVDKEDGKGLSTNDLTNDLITDIASAKKASHTHSNKGILDGITNLSVNKWNTVDNKVDKVPGKGLSENDFTSTLKSNYDKAVEDRHTHTNKTVLDNFSESGGQLLYSGESISGKTEIDDTQSSTNTTYSSSKIEELIEAGGGGGGGTPNALTKEVVTELPSYENAKDNVLYLIEDTTTSVPAAELIDDENVSLTKTYSSQKITDLLDNKVDYTNFNAHTTDTDIHVTPDKKTSWDNAATNSHTHNNKSILDKFSESSDGNLLYDGSSIGSGSSVDSYTKSETDNLLLNKVDKVSGKGLSENDLTNTLKSNYDTAYNSAHTHSNKSTLDSITSTKVSDWDNASTSSHTHSNKTVLDGITAEKVSNWDNASSSGGGGMSCELLWTNSSTSSSFSKKSITLSDDINNYDFYEILFINNSTNKTSIITTNKISIPSNLNSTLVISYIDPISVNFTTTKSNAQIQLNTYSRNHLINTSGQITIGDCSHNSYAFVAWNPSLSTEPTSNKETSTSNSYLIPYKVLGYKL